MAFVPISSKLIYSLLFGSFRSFSNADENEPFVATDPNHEMALIPEKIVGASRSSAHDFQKCCALAERHESIEFCLLDRVANARQKKHPHMDVVI
jgi:hypothetical protein